MGRYQSSVGVRATDWQCADLLTGSSYTRPMDTITARDLLPANFESRLLHILETHPAGLDELTLIRQLAETFPDSLFAIPGALRQPLLLFQLHFLLFHELYRLSDKLIESQRELVVGALHIAIIPRTENEPAVSRLDPLRSYYLDWQQWLQTSQNDVQQLLDRFWNGLPSPVAEGELIWARTLFALRTNDGPEVIKPRYRRLMMEHHPDRGGDEQRGAEVNRAYRILSRHYQLR